eukprot:449912-Pleurochrysis_carterae.AAC.1
MALVHAFRLSAIYAKQGTIAEHWYVACCTALELGPRAFRVQLKIRRLECGSERPSSKYLKAGKLQQGSTAKTVIHETSRSESVY